MFDKSWTVIMGPGTAGPVAGPPIELGLPDTGETLELKVTAAGISAMIFAGKLSTTDCQNIINENAGTPQVNRNEIIGMIQSGGITDFPLTDDVRAITVYFTGTFNPGTANQAVGVTIRVRTAS